MNVMGHFSISVAFDLSAVPKTTALTSMLLLQRSKEPEPPKRQKGRRRKKEPRRMTLSMPPLPPSLSLYPISLHPVLQNAH